MHTLTIILACLSGLALVTLIGFLFVWMEDDSEMTLKDIEKMNDELARKYGNKHIKFPIDE